MHPFCEDMVVSAQGQIYDKQDNLVTDDTSPTVADSCSLGKRSSSTGTLGDRMRGAGGHARKDGNKKAPAAVKHTDGAIGTLYPVEYADIMAGPATIQSMSKGILLSGWFQSTLFMDSDSTPIVGPAPTHSHLVRPNEIKLKIWDAPKYNN